MSVAFDSVLLKQVSGSTTSFTTGAWTIGSTANRMALVHIVILAPSTSITAVTIGGVSGFAVSGADSGDTNNAHLTMWAVFNPPSGSQTATITISPAAIVVVGVIVANGVDQLTGVNNGTFKNQAITAISLPVTSQLGDLTSTMIYDIGGGTPSSNFTVKWGASLETDFRGGDIGPGTATPTHIWTGSLNGAKSAVGANFIAFNITPITGLGKRMQSVIYSQG